MNCKWPGYIVLLFLLSCNVNNGDGHNNIDNNTPHVLLVSFDGFSYDYVQKFNPPNFDHFINNGASSTLMQPSYPSKTFPNHYTIVTGLYPGNHGLVDNSFYDSLKNEIYRISDRSKVEDEYYYGGIPLWQLAQMQGMKSASYFWVGSEAPVTGSYPDYYYKYDGSVANESRIEKVFEWLKLPDSDRPRFISIYFSFIDDVGHNSGPNSDEINEAVLEADRLLDILMDGVSSLALNINVILVSDHGMYPMTSEYETYIEFDKLIDHGNDSFLSINNGTQAHIYSMTNEQLQLDSLYERLKIDTGKGYSVYRKEDLPEEWHYQNDRTGDVLVVADPGKYLIKGEINNDWDNDWGTHGFDPVASPEMGAIFYANGPNIAKGIKIDGFENVHVYPFIAKILGLDVPEIDGKLEVLESIYVKNE